MCNDCCKAFTGWCKAFTKTEIVLCVVQALLLAVFIAFLTFLILHLVVCSRNKQRRDGPMWTESNLNVTSSTEVTTAIEVNTDKIDKEEKSSKEITITKNITDIVPDFKLNNVTIPYELETSTVLDYTEKNKSSETTLDKSVKCTWKPSAKTKASTHFYEDSQDNTRTIKLVKSHDNHKDIQVPEVNMKTEFEDNRLLADFPNGKEVQDSRKQVLIALAKIKPPQDITFGCTLTVVTQFWTLTAASCIEAIEEVDSLDLFVMIQEFKEENQQAVPIADVVIHPYYQGVNLSYNVAALKSANSLVSEASSAVTLPSILDYFLITIGERLTLLGYGDFRSNNSEPAGGVREAWTHCVPAAQCRAQHAGPLCAGVLRARAAPCRYCAGTPLLRRRVLLGIMSDSRRCGAACQPALFVNIALVADWLLPLVNA